MNDPNYHLQLIVIYETGHVAYSTFTPEEWMLADDRYLRETQDREVIETRLILHRSKSSKSGDHVRIREYER